VAALSANVTFLLEISYGKKVGLWAGRKGGGAKFYLFCLVFFCIAEKRLEEWISGYQQVIHNSNLPTVAIVQVVTAPA